MYINMEEHLDSHENAPVAQPSSMIAGQNQTGQVQVAADAQNDQIVTWEASEFIQYDKGFEWYVTVFCLGVILAIGMYFFIDIIGSVVVMFMAIGLIVYGKFKPRNLRYTVSSHGISIGENDYSYSEFRSFSLAASEGVNSILLVPMQRFMVPVTIYLAPENVQQVIQVLSQHLPNQQREPDLLDKVTAFLRF